MTARTLRLAVLAATLALALPAFGALAASTDPAEVGRWSAPFDGQVPAVNMVLLSDGSVLLFSGNDGGDQDFVYFFAGTLAGEARVLAPPYDAASVFVPGNEDGGARDLFCSGQTVLSDGRVLVAGGTEAYQLPDIRTPLDGTTDVRAFDPSSDTFEDAGDMGLQRWYPSIIELPDGRALAASGIGTLTNPATHQAAIEVYDPATDAWTTLAGGDNVLPLYPRLHVVPGGPLKGDVYYSTVGTLWGTFGEHPLEGAWNLQQTLSFAPDGSASWRVLGPSVFGVRQHANVVPLALDPADGYAPSYLTFGGTLNRGIVATPFVEMADLSMDPPTNTVVAPMNHARWHANGVALPTGEILAVGGGAYDNVMIHGQKDLPILPAESFDPATGAWTELAPMTVERMYHSTAVLLPDARVLVGGHVPLAVPWKVFRDNAPMGLEAQVREKRLEIFEPPYLFHGPRPVIAAATDAVGYGGDIVVETADTDASAVLVRPGSTTHAFDADQRVIKLVRTGTGDGTATFRAPPDGAVAPPGAYMLFLLKDSGSGPVPSVAEFVHVS